MKVLVWNTEWARPNSRRESEILSIFDNLHPDFTCITEGYIQTWEKKGFCISSEEDYGYPITEGRRKVILVSKKEWTQTDNIGSGHLPPGRYCYGRTYDLDIFGVCIPWRDAHVKTGHKNRSPWEDHQIYLKYLKNLIDSKRNSSIVMGDFNQRIPRKYSSVDVYNKLIETFCDHYKIATSGIIEEIGKQSIDHVAISKNLNLSDTQGISNHVNGISVSDHFGIYCRINIE